LECAANGGAFIQAQSRPRLNVDNQRNTAQSASRSHKTRGFAQTFRLEIHIYKQESSEMAHQLTVLDLIMELLLLATECPRAIAKKISNVNRVLWREDSAHDRHHEALNKML
jgi:predicted DNA-binding ribbon-helix-helix protein